MIATYLRLTQAISSLHIPIGVQSFTTTVTSYRLLRISLQRVVHRGRSQRVEEVDLYTDNREGE